MEGISTGLVYTLSATYLIAITLIVALLLRLKRPAILADEPSLFNESFYAARWYWKLNIGAVLITPYWLIANGMLLSAVVYLVVAYTVPLLAQVVSLFLLFKGSEISWHDGARWGNDHEAFQDAQLFTDVVGVIVVVVFVLISQS